MAKTVTINGREIPVTICPPRMSALPWHLTEVEENPISDATLDLMRRQGACPDDCEVTAPFIDGNPSVEAGDTFFSRPLRFEVPIVDKVKNGGDLIEGFNQSVADEIRRRRKTHFFGSDGYQGSENF